MAKVAVIFDDNQITIEDWVYEKDPGFLKRVIGDWPDHQGVWRESINENLYMMTVWVDDRGLEKQLPRNVIASSFRSVFMRGYVGPDFVGPAVITWTQVPEPEVDIPGRFIQLLHAIKTAHQL